MAGEPLPEAVKAEIIKHLSSEITTQVTYLSTLRSRVALTMLVGPFVVFGSFLFATKGDKSRLNSGSNNWLRPQLLRSLIWHWDGTAHCLMVK